MDARARWNKLALPEHPGVVAPSVLWVVRHLVHPVVRVLHRATLEGTEHLPPGRPFLLVGNHPSSLGVGEFSSFMATYARAFQGTPPPLAAFMLAAFFTLPPFARAFELIGGVPSTYSGAEHALAKGVPLAVFPGGAAEALRPFWKMDRVDLMGRKGFLRIARKAWVPIVPLGFRGVAAPMLFSSRILGYLFVWPWLAGQKLFPVSLLTVIGAALIVWLAPFDPHWRALGAFGWAASPFTLLSWWPATVRIRIGAPIAPESLFGARGSDDEAALDRAVGLIESAIADLQS